MRKKMISICVTAANNQWNLLIKFTLFLACLNKFFMLNKLNIV